MPFRCLLWTEHFSKYCTLLIVSGLEWVRASNSSRNPLGRDCCSTGCSKGEERGPSRPVKSTSSISMSCSISEVCCTHCARTSASTSFNGCVLLLYNTSIISLGSIDKVNRWLGFLWKYQKLCTVFKTPLDTGR